MFSFDAYQSAPRSLRFGMLLCTVALCTQPMHSTSDAEIVA